MATASDRVSVVTAHRPPGPRRPLLGALISSGRDPLKLFTGFARDYGDIVHFTLSGEQVFFLNHPQYIRDVLVTHQKNFTKSRGLERAKKLLGEGLLTSEGAAHLRQRRLLQPAFHRDRIAGYADVMAAHGDRLRRRWQDGAVCDVSKEMMRLTLSIVGKTLFDSDVESQADEIGVAVSEVLETFWLTLLPMQGLINLLPLPALRRGRRSRERLDALIYALIAERRATGRDHGDLLSMLLAAQDQEGGTGGLSDVQVRDEALTLILAGHETTANALTCRRSPT
jgi:cytochrome P450